jgi:hypothetical protein
MNILPTPSRHRAAAMTLLALETMPCGCVAGVYQARPTIVEVEFVEAKGPHCVFAYPTQSSQTAANRSFSARSHQQIAQSRFSWGFSP